MSSSHYSLNLPNYIQISSAKIETISSTIKKISKILTFVPTIDSANRNILGAALSNWAIDEDFIKQIL